ncbi:hypothetical protein PR048_021995 [Dryococelus australis]|uniref:Uncharacterized protein n=1 Tax=Dryococelus australis TaxID=614101 RepID=A0ABQ9GZU7_9NEOP|nr:hypothetical protein PR048_021995 [Dryococelus australis]
MLGEKESELAAAEGTYAYHTVTRNHTFRSMEFTTKFIQAIFEPKFTCARTKVEPYDISKLESVIRKVNFLSVMSAASNHKYIQIFCVTHAIF